MLQNLKIQSLRSVGYLCASTFILFGCQSKVIPAASNAAPPTQMAPTATPIPDASTKTGQNPAAKASGKDVKATFYGSGDGFSGKKTASGEVMNPQAHTAASPTLPLGSKVKVVDKETGKQTEVTINDRQPKKKGATIDLSKKAAEDLGITDKGTATVAITPVP